MELACSLHVSHADVRVEKAARLVAEAGWPAFEISPWLHMELTERGLNSVKRCLRRNRLSFAGFTYIYPPDVMLASPSPASRKKSVVYTKQLIEAAHTLGGKVIVWGSGRARNPPKGVPLQKGCRWLMELLKASAPLADKRGVKIAIEPINRFESMVIHTTKEALMMARIVNRPSVGIVYDTFHTSLEEKSFTKPILLAGNRLAAVHVSDCNRKIPGRGHIDFPPIFEALRKVGYDGYVTLEAILDRDPRRDLVAAKKYIEKLIN